MNVLRSGSAEGLSALSFELETGGLLVHASYGYVNRLPFSAYGWALAWAAVVECQQCLLPARPAGASSLATLSPMQCLQACRCAPPVINAVRVEAAWAAALQQL